MTSGDLVKDVTIGYIAIGAIGTAIEKIGNAVSSPKLVAVGQRLEAIALDLGKFIGGS